MSLSAHSPIARGVRASERHSAHLRRLLVAPRLPRRSRWPKQILRDHGITADAYLPQTYVGFVSGAVAKSWKYGGKATIDATFDTHKFGLWPGLSINIFQERDYGQGVSELDSGLLLQRDGIVDFPWVGGHDEELRLSSASASMNGFPSARENLPCCGSSPRRL